MAAHAAKRPQPLLNRATVTWTISGLTTALVMFGIIPQTVGDQLNAAVIGIVGGVAVVASVVPPIVHAITSRSVVTPVSDPRDDDGNELVPAGSEHAAAPLTDFEGFADDTTDALNDDVDAALAAADAIHPSSDDPDASGGGLLLAATGTTTTTQEA